MPTIVENNEALDFTSRSKVNTWEKCMEIPVLDLSFKKQDNNHHPDHHPSSPSSATSSSTSCTAHSPVSDIVIPRQITPPNSKNYGELESCEKSPFEGRHYMVTPPSETDSPKKSKFEPTYDHISASLTTDAISCMYPMVPINHGMPTIPTILPPALPNMLVGQQPITTPSVHHHHPSVISDDNASSSTENGKKVTRPFKAYPKDPLTLIASPEMVYDPTSSEAYSEFRKRMLESVRKNNEGTNIKMRRISKSPTGIPTSTQDDKDAAYWERRRKNNEAAKRSRDARRVKEDEIAIRAAFLERENMKLKYELISLRNETAKLRCIIYNN